MVWTMVTVHVFLSFCYYEDNVTYYRDGNNLSWAVLYNLLWGVFGLLVVIACIYLLKAVEKIRAFVTDRGEQNHLNTKQLRTHSACFSF
jgi:nitric oxide reductase large subunit